MADTHSQIEQYLAGLPNWQRDNLLQFRNLIHNVCPDVTEDFKWSVPVFLIGKKMIFAMSAFKAHTKYNFIGNGAVLSDPHKLFNNGLDSKKSRGIDLREGETIDPGQLKELIEEAIGYDER